MDDALPVRAGQSIRNLARAFQSLNQERDFQPQTVNILNKKRIIDRHTGATESGAPTTRKPFQPRTGGGEVPSSLVES